jgi:N-hydroxyarylamine O-acetyltransferase
VSDDLVEGYLRRLRVGVANAPPDRTALGDLHRAHLVHVPFENLDIHLERPIDLATHAVLHKVVTQGRGGFCYELNSAFAWLLGRLGLDVDLLQAQVYGGDGALGPAFDHLALRVSLGGDRFVADVGFGAHSTHPLLLDARGPQTDPAGTFEVRAATAADGDESWDVLQDEQPVYRVDGRRRRLTEFEPMCRFHQTSPDSHFTRGAVCTCLRSDGGRVTISGSTLIVTSPDGERTQQRLDRAALEAAYAEHFGYGPPLVPLSSGDGP